MAWTDPAARQFLRASFAAAVASADPRRMLAAHLPAPPKGRVIVVGAGKCTGAMAEALEAAWPDQNLSGLVVVPHGDEPALRRIRVLHGGHPVPDADSEIAGRALLDTVRGLGAEDLVIALVSGGASAMLAAPASGLTLADKQAVNRALLASGAPIDAMNTVRKHLSAIKGGRLAAAAAPARVLTLAISDVPGDDPAVIGSAPTLPDRSTLAEARAVLGRYGIAPPDAVRRHLAGHDETPKPGSLATEVRVIATPSAALEAAAAMARAAGLTPIILGDALQGEAREMGQVLAGIAVSARRHGHPAPAPCLLLSGGESTVTLGSAKHGRGGRNTEFLAAFGLALHAAGLAPAASPNIWALAADTDGIDGASDAAGALLAPDTLSRAAAAGANPAALLAAHDSYNLFAASGDLLLTGPTRTNVNDFRAILIG